MDEELKTYLEGKFADLHGKFADVDGKFADIDGKFADIDGAFATMRMEFAAIRTRIDETNVRIEETETRLLTEFWKWGRNSDRRTRLVEQNNAATAERLSEIEERIFTLERKLAGHKE